MKLTFSNNDVDPALLFNYGKACHEVRTANIAAKATAGKLRYYEREGHGTVSQCDELRGQLAQERMTQAVLSDAVVVARKALADACVAAYLEVLK